MGLQSGLVQGSFSFVITLIFNSIMEFVFGQLKIVWLTAIISILGLIGSSYGINALAGTPEILSTIAPGAILGSFYVVSYVKGLSVLNATSHSEDL